MIWKSYKFDWLAINKTTQDYQIWLTLVNWKKLDTRDEQILLQGVHGVKSSPSLANARNIVIEGLIMSDSRGWLSQGMDFLDKLFALQSRWFTTETKEFVVVDEQDREFWIDTKIKQSVDYKIFEDDYIAGADRKFRVVLQGDDPRFFETIENLVEWSEWNYWGFKLGVKLGAKMNEFSNETIVIWTWNIWTPCKFVITANANINNPFKILNLDSWRFFVVEDDFISGDILEIDTWKYTITKNWVNIKALRGAWSSWLQIFETTRFGFYDIDWTLLWSDFDVKIYFSNVLL